MILPIKKVVEDSILREISVDIIKGSEFLFEDKLITLSTLIQSMFETMYQTYGIGLAAPQVGYSASLFVVDIEISPGAHFKKAFINPVIKDKFGVMRSMEERCLSIPEVSGNVFRYGSILLHYYDENFKKHYEFFHDMEARVIQHEVDHLFGILFTDLLL